MEEAALAVAKELPLQLPRRRSARQRRGPGRGSCRGCSTGGVGGGSKRRAEEAVKAAEAAETQAAKAAKREEAEAAKVAEQERRLEEDARVAEGAAKKAQQEQMLQNQIADVKKHPSFPVFWKHTLESLSDEEQYEFGEHDPEADLAAWEDFLAFEDAKSKKLQEATRPKKATADDLAKQTAQTLGAERSQKEKGMLQETGLLNPEALQRAAERAAKRKQLLELIQATKARKAAAPAASEDDAARRQLGWKPAEERPEEKQPMGQQPMDQEDQKAAAPAPAPPQEPPYTRRAAANFLARLSQNGDRLKTLPPNLQDALKSPDSKAEMIQMIHSAGGHLDQIVAHFQKEHFVASRTRDNMAPTPLTRLQLEQIYGPETDKVIQEKTQKGLTIKDDNFSGGLLYLHSTSSRQAQLLL